MSTNKGPFVISAKAGTVAHLVLDQCRALYAGSDEVRFVSSDQAENSMSPMEINLSEVPWIRCGRFFSMYPNKTTSGCVLLVSSKTRSYPSRIKGMALQIRALITKLKVNGQVPGDYTIVRKSIRRGDKKVHWALH
jgi:hypothetical protein